MREVLVNLKAHAHPAVPIALFYAYKQKETNGEGEIRSTGWETFLEAIIQAGFVLAGTWPIRTEGSVRINAQDTNALASSIVLVCRPRPEAAPRISRREFRRELEGALPQVLQQLQDSGIAPIDLAQALIGRGMAIFSRYAAVLDAEGRPLSVGAAMRDINAMLECLLAEQEGELDETLWAITWFEQHGFAAGQYGQAEVLVNSKNTTIERLIKATIVESRAGKVRLLRPQELPADWDPTTSRTAWAILHHCLRVFDTGGEEGLRALLGKLGSRAGKARTLAYRLFAIAERRRWLEEAQAYNGLVRSWPAMGDIAAEAPHPEQISMFAE